MKDVSPKLYRAHLGGLESYVQMGHYHLVEQQRKFTQEPDSWLLFLFDHSGTMFLKNLPHAYEPGSIGLIGPGTKCEFNRVGTGTLCYYARFKLSSTGPAVTLPALSHLLEFEDLRRKEMVDSMDLLSFSTTRAIAFLTNLLWSISKPAADFRKADIIYDAEDWIRQHLSDDIRIGELTHTLQISHTHLLTLFREEHGCTIQEYIREQRVELARKLLAERGRTIKSVAASCGVSDLHQFNKLIRTYTGQSPRALQQLLQRR